MHFPSRLRRASATAWLLLIAACDNSPTASSPDQRTAIVNIPSGRSAMVLEFSPANAVRQVAIGPGADAPGAYFVSGVMDGRVLVYTDSTFPESMQMRLWLHAEETGSVVQARVQSTAAADGQSDHGELTHVRVFP